VVVGDASHGDGCQDTHPMPRRRHFLRPRPDTRREMHVLTSRWPFLLL